MAKIISEGEATTSFTENILEETEKSRHYQEFEFTEHHLSEIKQQAIIRVGANNLEKLSWDAAWSGCYPEEPTEQQIELEYETLKAKAGRILSGQVDISEEYPNIAEHLRMLALEDCKTFDIWQ